MRLKTEEILNKDVSRQEFLKYTGAALMAVAGVGSFLKSFNLFGDTMAKQFKQPAPDQIANYGTSTYGGKKG